MNVDTLHWQNDEALPVNMCADAGYNSCRDALALSVPIEAQIAHEKAQRDHGMLPLRVLARESFLDSEWTDGRFRDRIRWWLNRLGSDGMWQAGNEPESGGGEHSSIQSPEQSGKLVTDTRFIIGSNTFLFTPNLSLGNPHWPRQNGIASQFQEANYFSHSLYEMAPSVSGARVIFDNRRLQYWIPDAVESARDLGLPLVVPEFGAKRQYFSSEAQRAVYFLQCIAELTPYIEGIWFYCYAEVMYIQYALQKNAGLLPEDALITWDRLKRTRFSKEDTTMGQTLEQFIIKHASRLGKIWVEPTAGATGRYAIADEYYLIEYVDRDGVTWVTPLKQDSSFFA